MKKTLALTCGLLTVALLTGTPAAAELVVTYQGSFKLPDIWGVGIRGIGFAPAGSLREVETGGTTTFDYDTLVVINEAGWQDNRAKEVTIPVLSKTAVGLSTASEVTGTGATAANYRLRNSSVVYAPSTTETGRIAFTTGKYVQGPMDLGETTLLNPVPYIYSYLGGWETGADLGYSPGEGKMAISMSNGAWGGRSVYDFYYLAFDGTISSRLFRASDAAVAEPLLNTVFGNEHFLSVESDAATHDLMLRCWDPTITTNRTTIMGDETFDLDDSGVVGGSVLWVDGTPDLYDMAFDHNTKKLYILERADDEADHRVHVFAIPEPATMGLLGLGFAGMALLRRRRGRA